ncbi:MAG: hypothetical protein PVG45_01195 [Gammaproteobacteria bacterium]|jgi:hypothetical protein
MCGILSGCTVDNDQQIYSTDQMLTDEYGLTLKPSKNMYIDFDRISKVYADTMTCMGMTATGPTVEFKSFSFAGLGGAWAFYHPVESTIWINTDEDDIVLKRSASTDIEALEHEFIHHILHKNGASDESRAHSSPLFKKCGLGVKSSN